LRLVLPSSFWTKDPALQVFLDNMTSNAIAMLEQTNLFLCAEVGYGVSGAQLPISVTVMSDTTLQLCKQLTNQKLREKTNDESITFGFFGGLYAHKGVSLILEASKRATSKSRYRIVFFVPPHQLGQIADFEFEDSECVVVNTNALQYEEYLASMSSVSAVLCCYDTGFYQKQMSGVVTEAAALGLPIIVTKGTTLHRFLLTYSPGAAVPVSYDATSLYAALALPQPYWHEKRRSALISAPLVQELMSCRRFLTIALGY
jgi:glycosyltransferase involved in cell wall biosynthesis